MMLSSYEQHPPHPTEDSAKKILIITRSFKKKVSFVRKEYDDRKNHPIGIYKILFLVYKQLK